MEFVFVVPRRQLFGEAYPQGFKPFGEDFDRGAFEAAAGQHGYFVERDHAESNPDLKQIIPYSIVVRDGEILLLRRLSKGGESRLHNKLSIGVGGHINPEDLEGISELERAQGSAALFEAGSHRELHEELVLSPPYTATRVGILNDDSNPVGAVHVGLVQLVHATGDVTIREDDVLEGRFVTPGELQQQLADGANFETWSATLVRRLTELIQESTGALA